MTLLWLVRVAEAGATLSMLLENDVASYNACIITGLGYM